MNHAGPELATFGAAAEQSLQAWAEGFARPRHAHQQGDYARARSSALLAAGMIARNDRGKCHFETLVVIHRSAEDEEFAQVSRHWRLDVDGSRLRLRRWRNFASQSGASQSAELDAAGAAAELLPPSMADWWPSLRAALAAPEALHQAGACQIDPSAAPATTNKPPREPSVSADDAPASAPATDWRGLGLLALLIVVGTPMKIADSIGDGARHLWQRLRSRG